MAITIDWGQRIIHIPKADLSLVQLTPTEIRSMDLNWFRMQLKDLEDSMEGMCFPDTHRHNTEVSLGGLTYARVIEIINGYTITFEDGQYAVNLIGANSNVADVVNVNQVSVRSANSAGMTSSPALEYSSFNGGVTVDLSSAYSGTTYPVGTPRQPVNNMADALLIATYRGFNTFFILGSATIDSGGNYESMAFIGESVTKSTIEISDAANVYKAEFSECNLKGTLDGEAVAKHCKISDLLYINGVIESCLLEEGTIVLGGSKDAIFLDCWSGIPGQNLPTIDMGGTGQGLIMRNFSGELKIINKTGPEEINITMLAGKITLDSTIVSGDIRFSGIGSLINNTALVIDTNDLINTQLLQQASFNGYVAIKTDSGYSGTIFPTGTLQRPVNNLNDAKSIALERGFNTFYILGNLDILAGENIDELIFIGSSPSYSSILLSSGCSVLDTTFKNISVSGYHNGITNYYNCDILENHHIHCSLYECRLVGPISMDSSSETSSYFIDCYSGGAGGINYPTIDLNHGQMDLSFRGYDGSIRFTNMTDVGCNVTVNLKSGKIYVDSSCTEGNMIARGIGELEDNSNKININYSGLTPYSYLSEIQYSSFNGGVWIDVATAISGTAYPAGTPSYPVNNIEDAKTIANYRGFDVINILSNLTVASGTNIDYFTFKASDWWLEMHIEPGSSCVHTNFEKLTLYGEMCGTWNVAIDCWVYDITNFAGWLIGGSFETIALAPYNEESLGASWFDNIVPMYPDSVSLVVMNTNTSIACTGLNCNFELRSLEDGSLASIGITSGIIELDSSCIGGDVVISGNGTLVDNSTGVNINDAGLMTKTTVVEAINDSIGPQIEYASFNGGVTIDINSTTSGIEYPAGTPLEPVNNITDALLIAEARGLVRFFIDESMTIASGINIANYTVVGRGMAQTVLTIEPGAVVSECNFENVYLQGYLGGKAIYGKRCALGNIYEACGGNNDSVLVDCVFADDCTLQYDSSSTACLLLVDCNDAESDPGNTSYLFNFNDSLGCIKGRNISGGFAFENASRGNLVTLAYITGLAHFKPSMSDFICYIGGSVILIEEQTGGTLNKAALISRDLITEAVWNEPLSTYTTPDSTGQAQASSKYNNTVHMSNLYGFSGINYPIGTRQVPVNSISDAITIASGIGIGIIHILGEAVGDTTISGFQINGCTGFQTDSFNFNNFDYNNITFSNLTLSGTLNGENNTFNNCYITNVDNMSGELFGGRLSGDINLRPGGYFSGIETVIEGDYTTIDLGNTSGTTFSFDVNSGYLLFKNAVEGCLIEINLRGGEIELDPSCIGGDFYIEGYGTLYNYSTMTIKGNNLIDSSELDTLATMNDSITRILGLVQENQFLDQTVYTIYNSQKLLTSGRIRLYSDAISVGTDNNVVATYQIIATWSGDEMQSYKVIKI